MDPALKQRLLGATVLIALAVIFVPMFFPGPPRQDKGDVPSLDIPPKPDDPMSTRVFELDIPAAAPSAASANAATSSSAPPRPASSEAGRSAPGASEASDAERAADGDADRATAAKPAPGRAAVSSYVVSLGVFSRHANADARLARAKLLGYPAYIKAMQVDGKPAQSVLVGPFDGRASAEAARLRLKGKIDGAEPSLLAMTHARSEDAPADAVAADQAGGWAVQLAAFRKQADAVKLRDTLRKAGFEAFLDDTRDADGAWWRVRVGPRSQRADAEALKQAIKEKTGQSGLVVTHP